MWKRKIRKTFMILNIYWLEKSCILQKIKSFNFNRLCNLLFYSKSVLELSNKQEQFNYKLAAKLLTHFGKNIS